MMLNAVFHEYLFAVETNGGSILSEPLLFESVKDRSFAAAIEAEHDHAVARHQGPRYPRSHGGAEILTTAEWWRC